MGKQYDTLEQGPILQIFIFLETFFAYESTMYIGTGNTKSYHFTVDLLFDWFGISYMTTDNFCFYLKTRLIQTSQTGGQWYSDQYSPIGVYPGKKIN